MTEATPEDLQEQAASPARDFPAAADTVVAAEVDPFDAAEQQAAVGPGQHTAARDLPLEADPADAAEQAVVVEFDEDEVR